MRNEDDKQGVGRTRVILSQVLACSALNSLLVSLGMSVCFVTTLLPQLLNANEGLFMDPKQASWFGSIIFLCQPLGSIFSGPLVDCFGRKKALFFVNIPYLTAWILMHNAWNVPLLFMANALLGFGTGIIESPSVTYVAEISEPSVRGVLTVLSSCFTSFGSFAAFLLGSILEWRTAALVCLAGPVSTMILALLVPETPIWLLSKGRKEEAMRSLRALRGWATEDDVAQEFQQLLEYSEKSKLCVVCVHQNITPTLPHCKHSKQFFIKRAVQKCRYLMLTRETLRPFQLVMAYFSIHTICGLAPIRSNLINVSGAFGMNDDPKRIIILVGILAIFMSLLSASLVKFIGKRMLILSTTAGCVCSYAALAVYASAYLPSHVFSYINETFPKEKSLTPLVIFYSLVCFSQLGIPWVLVAELFPFRSRGIAAGLSAAFCYFVTFLASKTNLDLEQNLHLSGTFGLYAIFGFLGFVFLYFYMPETEGKSLEEIEKMYRKRGTFAGNCYTRRQREHVELMRPTN